MRLYAIKDTGNEFYFQIEKAKETLKIIDKIAYLLFKDDGYEFSSRWQSGFPNKEDHESIEKKGIYMGVVVGFGAVHIIIIGLKGKMRKKVKDIIGKKYKF